MAESGSPIELFRKQGGLFRRMYIRHGIMEDQVIESANIDGEAAGGKASK